jgi:hypothetical protein
VIGALGSRGEFLADMITMMTNATISFVVFFPIFRLIFKRKVVWAGKKLRNAEFRLI